MYTELDLNGFIDEIYKQELIGKDSNLPYKCNDIISQTPTTKIYNGIRKNGSIDERVVIKTSMEEKDILREFDCYRLFHHSNIINCLELIISNRNNVYLSLEYGGNNINSFISQGDLIEVNSIHNIVNQLCQAISLLHHSGYVYGDIKPQNILINNDKVKLCDFGNCHPQGTQITQKTRGTVYYSPPEALILEFNVQYEISYDVWSLGVVWMELLTGNYLLESDNVIEQILKIFKTVGSPNTEDYLELYNYPMGRGFFNEHIAPCFRDTIKKIRPDYDEHYIDVIQQMLQINRRKRPNILEVQKTLEQTK